MAQKDKKKEAPAQPVLTAADVEFEAEVVRRNPGRKITRFEFPSDVEEARAVYLFELKAKDELAAAEMADATMSDAERKSIPRAIEAERREGIRLSIVGLVCAGDDGELVRIHVDQSKPLMAIDDWSVKAWAALRTFFGDLNGVSTEELGNAVRGARKLGAASALPATQPRAATGT